jgi:ABC-type enterochelin transport system ATPase subunit
VGGIASITEVYPVLIVSDVSKSQNFQSGINQIVGANSGSIATILSVVNPDLIRETGKVVYMESSENVITKDINTTERVRVVIKF